MTRLTKFHKALLFSCIGTILALCTVVHLFLLPHIHDERVGQTAQYMIPTILPVTNNLPSDILSLKLDYKPSQPTQIKIVSSSCLTRITLNKQPVYFNPDTACFLFGETTLDLAELLVPGQNELTVEADNSNGAHILHVSNAIPDSFLFNAIKSVLLACGCIIIILLMHRLIGDWASGLLLALGFLLFSYYFLHSNFMEQTMDMPWHLHYILYINKYWWLPPTRDGWSFYHAPLYYMLAAPILWFGNWLGSFDPISILRLTGLACFLVFLAFCALILRLLLRNRWAYYCAFALVVFYPSGINFSARIDSHMLFYPLYTCAFYFMLLWLKKPKSRHLGIALAVSGVCFATRSNAWLLVPLLAMAVGYRCWVSKSLVINFRSGAILLGMFVFILGIAVNKGRPYYYNHYVYKSAITTGNIEYLPRELKVQNSLQHFLLLDTDTYINETFWGVWHNVSGRQYFWNSFLKSSLFGEFQWQQPEAAQILSILLLWFIIYGVCNMALDWKYYLYQREWWILSIPVWVGIAGLMHSRWEYPYACTQDFRYTYPSIISIGGLIGMLIQRAAAKREYTQAAFIVAPTIMFVGTSAYFFLFQ